MRNQLALETLAIGSATIEEAATSRATTNLSVRSTNSILDLRRPLTGRQAVRKYRPSAAIVDPSCHRGELSTARDEGLVDLANATVEAAQVNWPVAERRDVTLVCCTQSPGAVAGNLPQVRAAVSALIAILTNSSPSGAVVTCSSRMIDGEVVVSAATTRFQASLLDVGREMNCVRDENAPAPEMPGLGLDLWRASRQAKLQRAHLAFVPQRNGTVAFELWLGASNTRSNGSPE